jgi:hypothetical protein
MRGSTSTDEEFGSRRNCSSSISGGNLECENDFAAYQVCISPYLGGQGFVPAFYCDLITVAVPFF